MKRSGALARLALAAAICLLIWPALAHAIQVWSTDEEFTYGFLIPPIAVGLLWWRRTALRRSIGRGHISGLLIVITSMMVMLLSRRLDINVLGGLAVSPLLVGVAVYLWGWRTGREMLFPSGFLVFGLGLYRGLLSSIGFALQDITAVGSASLSHAIGLAVAREGLALYSTSGAAPFAFVVAQTCSGMSSLLSLLALASLWIYATRGPLPGRVAIVLSVVPLVIVANTTRVTLVLLVAAVMGEDAALGFFHGASSLLLFGLALVGLIGVSRMVGCKLRPVVTYS